MTVQELHDLLSRMPSSAEVLVALRHPDGVFIPLRTVTIDQHDGRESVVLGMRSS